MVDTAAESSSTLLAPPVAPDMAESANLKRRVTYLMLFRLVLISLVMGSTLLIAWLGDVDLQTPNAYLLLGIIAATYLLTIIYGVMINRVRNPLRFAYVQIGIDLCIATLLVHVTGGAQSAYTFFYPVSIIGAATVRYRRGAVVTALTSVGLYAAISMLGWFELLPIPEGQRILPHEMSALVLARSMGLNFAAFGAVGFLAINLGGQLARTSASLESERTAAADLYTLHEDIVRGLTSGLITVDARGTVLTLNQAAREILMVPAGAAPGRPLAALATPMAEALDALDPRESARRIEVDHTLESGRTLHLGITVSPLVDHTDRVHGRIINFQDLSEMREMELQVKQAERLATIGTIAAGVAHELRNPLASISGSIELLRSGAEDPADSAALMDIVTREVGRLDSLISELLEYTNPRPRQAVRFDLVELIRETLRVFSQDKKVEGVSVELETRDQPIHVTADPAKLRQVLWNLLRNAVEAARAGGGTVAVELSRSQEQALIDISDDGPGIAGDAVARIFEPFYTTRSGGTGLGLAIVRNIVSDHGGDIDVETEVGRGSRFSVSLPLGEPAERED